MSSDDLKDLRINQQVMVRCNPPIDGYYVGWVKSINDWTKTIGIVDVHDRYKQYPPRLILIINNYDSKNKSERNI